VKLGDMLATLSPAEKRELIMLFLQRVDVRPSASQPGLAPGSRLLELRLKFRVERLVEGMAEKLVIEEHAAPAASSRPLTMNLKVALAPFCTSTNPVTLLAPFRCDLGVTRCQSAAKPTQEPVLHPIHRARTWQRRLDSERGLNRVTLAKEEGIAPGSVTHYLKLLDLDEEIQKQLLELTTAAEVRRYSLNRMKALADLSGAEQRRQFAAC
jgi:hypothetical protein